MATRKSYRAAAVSLAAVLLVAQPAARAQSAVAEVGPSLTQHILNQINTYTQQYQDSTEYAEQAQRWYQTYRHYQQQMVKVQGMFMTLGVSPDKELQAVPEKQGVAERCGSVSLSVKALLQQFSLNPGGNITQQQRDLCARIQIANNRKYNAAVRFVNEISPALDKHLAALKERRNSSNEEGNLRAVAADMAAFDAWMAAQFQNWETQSKMYDAYIGTMQDTQRMLSAIALNGRAGPVGQVIKTTALRAALEN